MIKKYNSFREDSLLEGIINESMIYFSPKVRVMFNNILKKRTYMSFNRESI